MSRPGRPAIRLVPHRRPGLHCRPNPPARTDAPRREPIRVPAAGARPLPRAFAVADSDKPKSAPLPWLLLTGLLGVFAVGVPQTGGPAGAPAKKEEKKDADPPPNAASTAEDPERVSLTPVYAFHK